MTSGGLVPALGDYAHMASAKLITAAKGSEHSTERADLRGRRLVVAEEMTEDRALDVTAIKQIQDVPEITARLVHRDNMTFPASHSLICTSNYLPVVAETDHGTWRRLALVEFPYTFRKPGEALDDSGTEKRGDPALKQRVHDGADGQHDAAVTWAVDGAVRVAKEGADALALPAIVKDSPDRWRGTADRILGYWREHLTRDGDACITRPSCSTTSTPGWSTTVISGGPRRPSPRSSPPTARPGATKRRFSNNSAHSAQKGPKAPAPHVEGRCRRALICRSLRPWRPTVARRGVRQ